jgi:transcriptional regulator with XRE-family HTH domain
MPPRSQAHVALGKAIREIRIDQGLSQEAMALEANLHPTYVSGIERGLRNPSFTSLLRLADTLDIPVSEVLARAEASLE